MVSLIIPSTVCKRFKIQLLELSLADHTSLRFLNLCIGYLLITVLIFRFVVSLIVRSLGINLIILVLCFRLNSIPFVLPLLTHYYYHTSKKITWFSFIHMLYFISEITYLIISVLHQPVCRFEKI